MEDKIRVIWVDDTGKYCSATGYCTWNTAQYLLLDLIKNSKPRVIGLLEIREGEEIVNVVEEDTFWQGASMPLTEWKKKHLKEI